MEDIDFNTISSTEQRSEARHYTYLGWNLLTAGRHRDALDYFRDALKLDPHLEEARSGMAEALKAQVFVYRIFMRYSIWMNDLSQRNRWLVPIGFYILTRLILTLSRNFDVIRPYTTPVLLLLGVVAFSSWIIPPISNLLLRMSKYGQFLLSKEEQLSAVFVGISLLICISGLIGYLVLHEAYLIGVSILGFVLMPPLGVMFAPAKFKYVLLLYPLGMLLLGMESILTAFKTGELFNPYTIALAVSFIAFQWIANYLILSDQ